MSRFSFPLHQQPARVTLGSGSVRVLAELPLDDRTVVFATGQEHVLALVDESLAKKRLKLDRSQLLSKPPGEPTREMVEAGAAFLRTRRLNSLDRIVGVGGGSVLDWCRLSWAAASGHLDLATGKVDDGPAADRPPLWLVPTTCATGAEAAAVAVYLDHARKVPVVSRSFLADQVILDGQFLKGISAGAMARSLGDALTHAIEAYLSIVPGTLAKESAASALRLILLHARAEPSTDRNERLMEAGYLAGSAASNCSVGVVHAFAHSVASWGVPHGYACAVGLEAGLLANRDVTALSELARRVGFASVEALSSSIGEIVRGADGGQSVQDLRGALTESASRAEILKRMASDVCLRTNPQPLDSDALERFLDDVRARACTVEES
jgi:alcohol dehydrogenase class IV